VPLPLEFAMLWARHTGGTYSPNVHMRAYVLRQVLPTRPVPGRFRQAYGDDLDLVAQWGEAFTREALPDNDASQARVFAQRKVSQGEVFLWEDGGRPVSMAAKARPLHSSITVNYVYTPPHLRGRGYATACVATLSQTLLAEGWKCCTLFTDLANPTSNSIYQKIGYGPVCDYDEYHLG
jgi:predicted GNAT family acetyltransferase